MFWLGGRLQEAKSVFENQFENNQEIKYGQGDVQTSSDIPKFLWDSLYLVKGKWNSTKTDHKNMNHNNFEESEEKFMSKLRLGFSKLAASQIEQISEVMSNQLRRGLIWVVRK